MDFISYNKTERYSFFIDVYYIFLSMDKDKY